MPESKLIVESGSSTSEWAVLSDRAPQIHRTGGINPTSDQHFPKIFKESPPLSVFADQIDSISYYGAGVVGPVAANKVSTWLSSLFPNTRSIDVQSDLLAACRSTAGRDAAIVSILGTGSNSCVYDGTTITDNIPALGYVMSNEGGGTDIGKTVLQSYFYRQMPQDVKRRFEDLYPVTKAQLLQGLYQQPNPTSLLGHYAQFINECKHEEWRRSILTRCFGDFIKNRILPYTDYLRYELHFVGSIAYFCQDILREELTHYNLHAQSIVQKPIQGLIDWHNIR